MKHEMLYFIDELALLPGCACYAYGVADVEYTAAPAEPDVGIMRPYIDELWITGIALDGIGFSDCGRQLDSIEPLYKLIEEALYRDDALTQACLEHYEGGGGWEE